MATGVRTRQPVMLDQAFQRRHKPDYMLVLLSSVLLVLGLVVVYAIGPALSAQRHVSENYYISKQFIAILLGVIAFAVTANTPLKRWKHFIKPLAIVAGVATLIALVTPVTPEYPAPRWIRIAGLSLQSVELVKMALLLWLSYFLADRQRHGELDDRQKMFKPLLYIFGALAAVIAYKQKDLGSMMVLITMGGAMIYVAGIPMKRLAMAFAGIMACVVLLIAVEPYRISRITAFLKPQDSGCRDDNYQACQALIAVGSGGIKGKGLAHSVQAYGYLPEAANDSIFAIFAEKFGFIGSTVLLGLFVAFFSRIKNIIERAPDMPTRLLLTGILAWLSTQSIINIGAMVGLLPLKGITLPFISYGGTSIIFVLAAVGVVFNISRYTTYGANNIEQIGPTHDNRADRRGNGRPHYAHISRRP